MDRAKVTHNGFISQLRTQERTRNTHLTSLI